MKPNKYMYKRSASILIDTIYNFATTIAEFHVTLLLFSGLLLFITLFPDSSKQLIKIFGEISIADVKNVITNGFFLESSLFVFTAFRLLSLAIKMVIYGRFNLSKVISVLCLRELFEKYMPCTNMDIITTYFICFMILMLMLMAVTRVFGLNTVNFGNCYNKVSEEKNRGEVIGERGMACQVKDNEWYKRFRNVKKCHEAGHAVVAELLGLKVLEISIDDANNGGHVTVDSPPLVTPEELKKLVMIKYAGILAEKIYYKEATTGCMGSYDSDMECANRYLKQYILLSDQSISLTGYEEDYIKKQSIWLSKKWMNETKILLECNKKKLNETISKIK